ncbi:hypothetical protein [Sphingomonas sp.]|uniref:hypothetical protein n=1 Tax=Sphingomonas sp. TaxID=28214 RepID=UPI002DD6ABD1|nr:hypothetical protein [Sphingomonas sp.]
MTEKLIDESCLAMIDVRDDGDIAQIHLGNPWGYAAAVAVLGAPIAELLHCG